MLFENEYFQSALLDKISPPNGLSPSLQKPEMASKLREAVGKSGVRVGGGMRWGFAGSVSVRSLSLSFEKSTQSINCGANCGRDSSVKTAVSCDGDS